MIRKNGIPFLGTFNRTDDEDPCKVFRYHVEIDAFSRFGFTSCKGLKRQTDITEFREGGQNTTVQKSPGITKFPNVTLERGQILAAAFGALDVLMWCTQVFDVSSKKAGSAKDFRRGLDIVQFNKEGNEVARWKLLQAWPAEDQPFSDLDAMSSANSLEQMVLAHEGYRYLQASGATI